MLDVDVLIILFQHVSLYDTISNIPFMSHTIIGALVKQHNHHNLMKPNKPFPQ